METKRRTKLATLSMILFLIFTLNTHAQVTIGIDESPVSGAILQLKTLDESSQGTFNITANKGLGLPRVNLEAANYGSSDNSDVRLIKSLGLTGVTANAVQHTGLIVFNMTVSDIQGNATGTFLESKICKGVYVWMGDKWARSMVTPCP